MRRRIFFELTIFFCLATAVLASELLTIRLVTSSVPLTVTRFPLDEPIVPAAGGTGSFEVLCFTGSVLQVSAQTTNQLFVEYTTNLADWKPYPSPRFQLIFLSNSPPENIPLPLAGNMFFRSRL